MEPGVSPVTGEAEPAAPSSPDDQAAGDMGWSPEESDRLAAERAGRKKKEMLAYVLGKEAAYETSEGETSLRDASPAHGRGSDWRGRLTESSSQVVGQRHKSMEEVRERAASPSPATAPPCFYTPRKRAEEEAGAQAISGTAEGSAAAESDADQQEDIQMLQADPSLASQFDEVYGPGAAAVVLAEAEEPATNTGMACPDYWAADAPKMPAAEPAAEPVQAAQAELDAAMASRDADRVQLAAAALLEATQIAKGVTPGPAHPTAATPAVDEQLGSWTRSSGRAVRHEEASAAAEKEDEEAAAAAETETAAAVANKAAEEEAAAATVAAVAAKKATDEASAVAAAQKATEEEAAAAAAAAAAAKRTAEEEVAAMKKAAEEEIAALKAAAENEAAAVKKAADETAAANKAAQEALAAAKQTAETEAAAAAAAATLSAELEAAAAKKKVAEEEAAQLKKEAAEEAAAMKQAAAEEAAAMKEAAAAEAAALKKAAVDEAATKKAAEDEAAAMKRVAEADAALTAKRLAEEEAAALRKAAEEEAAAMKQAAEAEAAALKKKAEEEAAEAAAAQKAAEEEAAAAAAEKAEEEASSAIAKARRYKEQVREWLKEDTAEEEEAAAAAKVASEEDATAVAEQYRSKLAAGCRQRQLESKLSPARQGSPAHERGSGWRGRLTESSSQVAGQRNKSMEAVRERTASTSPYSSPAGSRTGTPSKERAEEEAATVAKVVSEEDATAAAARAAEEQEEAAAAAQKAEQYRSKLAAGCRQRQLESKRVVKGAPAATVEPESGRAELSPVRQGSPAHERGSGWRGRLTESSSQVAGQRNKSMEAVRKRTASTSPYSSPAGSRTGTPSKERAEEEAAAAAEQKAAEEEAAAAAEQKAAEEEAAAAAEQKAEEEEAAAAAEQRAAEEEAAAAAEQKAEEDEAAAAAEQKAAEEEAAAAAEQKAAEDEAAAAAEQKAAEEEAAAAAEQEAVPETVEDAGSAGTGPVQQDSSEREPEDESEHQSDQAAEPEPKPMKKTNTVAREYFECEYTGRIFKTLAECEEHEALYKASNAASPSADPDAVEQEEQQSPGGDSLQASVNAHPEDNDFEPNEVDIEAAEPEQPESSKAEAAWRREDGSMRKWPAKEGSKPAKPAKPAKQAGPQVSTKDELAQIKKLEIPAAELKAEEEEAAAALAAAHMTAEPEMTTAAELNIDTAPLSEFAARAEAGWHRARREDAAEALQAAVRGGLARGQAQNRLDQQSGVEEEAPAAQKAEEEAATAQKAAAEEEAAAAAAAASAQKAKEEEASTAAAAQKAEEAAAAAKKVAEEEAAAAAKKVAEEEAAAARKAEEEAAAAQKAARENEALAESTRNVETETNSLSTGEFVITMKDIYDAGLGAQSHERGSDWRGRATDSLTTWRQRRRSTEDADAAIAAATQAVEAEAEVAPAEGSASSHPAFVAAAVLSSAATTAETASTGTSTAAGRLHGRAGQLAKPVVGAVELPATTGQVGSTRDSKVQLSDLLNEAAQLFDGAQAGPTGDCADILVRLDQLIEQLDQPSRPEFTSKLKMLYSELSKREKMLEHGGKREQLNELHWSRSQLYIQALVAELQAAHAEPGKSSPVRQGSPAHERGSGWRGRLTESSSQVAGQRNKSMEAVRKRTASTSPYSSPAGSRTGTPSKERAEEEAAAAAEQKVEQEEAPVEANVPDIETKAPSLDVEELVVPRTEAHHRIGQMLQQRHALQRVQRALSSLSGLVLAAEFSYVMELLAEWRRNMPKGASKMPALAAEEAAKGNEAPAAAVGPAEGSAELSPARQGSPAHERGSDWRGRATDSSTTWSPRSIENAEAVIAAATQAAEAEAEGDNAAVGPAEGSAELSPARQGSPAHERGSDWRGRATDSSRTWSPRSIEDAEAVIAAATQAVEAEVAPAEGSASSHPAFVAAAVLSSAATTAETASTGTSTAAVAVSAAAVEEAAAAAALAVMKTTEEKAAAGQRAAEEEAAAAVAAAAAAAAAATKAAAEEAAAAAAMVAAEEEAAAMKKAVEEEMVALKKAAEEGVGGRKEAGAAAAVKKTAEEEVVDVAGGEAAEAVAQEDGAPAAAVEPESGRAELSPVRPGSPAHERGSGWRGRLTESSSQVAGQRNKSMEAVRERTASTSPYSSPAGSRTGTPAKERATEDKETGGKVHSFGLLLGSLESHRIGELQLHWRRLCMRVSRTENRVDTLTELWGLSARWRLMHHQIRQTSEPVAQIGRLSASVTHTLAAATTPEEYVEYERTGVLPSFNQPASTQSRAPESVWRIWNQWHELEEAASEKLGQRADALSHILNELSSDRARIGPALLALARAKRLAQDKLSVDSLLEQAMPQFDKLDSLGNGLLETDQIIALAQSVFDKARFTAERKASLCARLQQKLDSDAFLDGMMDWQDFSKWVRLALRKGS